MTFNGQSALGQSGTNYLRVNYGSSSAPDLSKIPTLISFGPDIIFVFGFNEGPNQIFTATERVEERRSEQRPLSVLGVLRRRRGHEPVGVQHLSGDERRHYHRRPAPAGQRQRAAIGNYYAPYGAFLTEFSGSSYATDGSADTLGPAGAYDILYLLAYSTVMVGKNPPHRPQSREVRPDPDAEDRGPSAAPDRRQQHRLVASAARRRHAGQYQRDVGAAAFQREGRHLHLRRRDLVRATLHATRDRRRRGGDQLGFLFRLHRGEDGRRGQRELRDPDPVDLSVRTRRRSPATPPPRGSGSRATKCAPPWRRISPNGTRADRAQKGSKQS